VAREELSGTLRDKRRGIRGEKAAARWRNARERVERQGGGRREKCERDTREIRGKRCDAELAMFNGGTRGGRDREGRQAEGGRNSHAARVSQRSRGSMNRDEGDGRGEKHGGERLPFRKREKRRPLRFPQRRRFLD